MFIAPRPENTSRQNSSQDKSELHWNGSTNVRILPVQPEFKRQNSFGSSRKNSFKKTKNSEKKMHFRSLSIPDVLLDIQKFERIKPAYSPNCHPIDLEGLQETAV